MNGDGQVRSKRITVSVAGVTFEGRQILLYELYLAQLNGTKLTGRLRREPENRYDPNAIAVEVDAKHVGYVPKELAAKLAAHIDAGSTLTVTEVRVTKGGDFRTVYGARVDVEMKGKVGAA